jgi:hypothetical protein
MSLSTLNGELWGDFIDVYWISHYLKHVIHVWNKNNDHIMVEIQDETNGNMLHIVYGNNHFELVDTFYQTLVSFIC